MLKIDFYILHAQTKFAKDRFVCQLTDKIWHQGHRVYIHTHSKMQAELLDDLLWTFTQDSFLPHDICFETEILSPAPICLGYADLNCEKISEGMDVLINLTETVPPFFEKFKRIAECVDDTPQAREAGRGRYRFYRDGGNELKSHDVHR